LRSRLRHLGEMTRSDQLGSLPAFAPERLPTTARFFQDLAVVLFLLRALFEVNPKTLQAEIGPHVARSVACLDPSDRFALGHF